MDVNHDGELDLVELSSLLLKLTGRAPGHAELELSLRELDSDASGTVSPSSVCDTAPIASSLGAAAVAVAAAAPTIAVGSPAVPAFTGGTRAATAVATA